MERWEWNWLPDNTRYMGKAGGLVHFLLFGDCGFWEEAPGLRRWFARADSIDISHQHGVYGWAAGVVRVYQVVFVFNCIQCVNCSPSTYGLGVSLDGCC